MIECVFDVWRVRCMPFGVHSRCRYADDLLLFRNTNHTAGVRIQFVFSSERAYKYSLHLLHTYTHAQTHCIGTRRLCNIVVPTAVAN